MELEQAREACQRVCISLAKWLTERSFRQRHFLRDRLPDRHLQPVRDLVFCALVLAQVNFV